MVLGGLGPRTDVRRLRVELEDARRRLAADETTRSPIGNVTEMLGIPQAGRGAAGSDSAGAAEKRVNGRRDIVSPADVPSAQTESGPSGETPSRDLETRIEEAVELWRLRSEIARNTFLANTDATPQEAARFDVIVASMNLRLEECLAGWAVHLEAGGRMTAETGVRMLHDLSGALVLTYDELDRNLSPGWREGGEDVELFDLIDPSVARPLIAVEGRFSPPRRRRLR